MALSIDFLSPDGMVASYLAPSGDAAVMCAATPMLTVPSDFCSVGPDVARLQPGFEHLNETRLASLSLIGLEKSSMRDNWILLLVLQLFP